MYPEWFVTNDVLVPSLNPSELPGPGAHLTLLHEATAQLNTLARKSTAIDPPLAGALRGELFGMVKDMGGLQAALKDVPVPSLHYFTGFFLTFFLVLNSIAIAQMKIEGVENKTLSIGEETLTCILGAFAVIISNMAFIGSFALIGVFHDPFGKDTEDFPIFTMADGAQQTCQKFVHSSK